MAALKLSTSWMRFIKESEALTGITPFLEGRPTTQRHIEISGIVANSSRFLDPRFVNGLITGKHREFDSLLRTGTEGGLRKVVPDASKMHVLFQEWIADAEEGLSCMWLSLEHQINEFAWRMHDRLICIHPFKTGNGRTARLMFSHFRCLLGLEISFISNEDAEQYYSHLDWYREKVFLPSLAGS